MYQAKQTNSLTQVGHPVITSIVFSEPFLLFGVTGTELEPIPTADGWRQGAPLEELSAHLGIYESI